MPLGLVGAAYLYLATAVLLFTGVVVYLWAVAR
jgi:hypothetical protein